MNNAFVIVDRLGPVDAAGLLDQRRSLGRPRARPGAVRWVGLGGVLCLALAACAGPVGAVRVDPKAAHDNLARSAITTGEPSWPTRKDGDDPIKGSS